MCEIGYKSIEIKSSSNEHYYKQGKDNFHQVFIHGYNSYSKEEFHREFSRYSFAKVIPSKPSKLEEFCKRFEKHSKYRLKDSFFLGGFLGASIGLSGYTFALCNSSWQQFIEKNEALFLSNIPSAYLTIPSAYVLGGIGYSILKYSINKTNEKKMRSLCSVLELNNRDAVEWAFKK